MWHGTKHIQLWWITLMFNDSVWILSIPNSAIVTKFTLPLTWNIAVFLPKLLKTPGKAISIFVIGYESLWQSCSLYGFICKRFCSTFHTSGAVFPAHERLFTKTTVQAQQIYWKLQDLQSFSVGANNQSWQIGNTILLSTSWLYLLSIVSSKNVLHLRSITIFIELQDAKRFFSTIKRHCTVAVN